VSIAANDATNEHHVDRTAGSCLSVFATGLDGAVMIIHDNSSTQF